MSLSWPLALGEQVSVIWVDEFELNTEALVDGGANGSFMINTICFFALERSVTCWGTLPESLIPLPLSPPGLYLTGQRCDKHVYALAQCCGISHSWFLILIGQKVSIRFLC